MLVATYSLNNKSSRVKSISIRFQKKPQCLLLTPRYSTADEHENECQMFRVWWNQNSSALNSKLSFGRWISKNKKQTCILFVARSIVLERYNRTIPLNFWTISKAPRIGHSSVNVTRSVRTFVNNGVQKSQFLFPRNRASTEFRTGRKWDE